MFDIIQFYKDYNIQYSTNSKNTQKGWINARCPFCEDHSDHLGYNIEKEYFYCWMCRWHSLYSTIQKLAPAENPKEIIKQYNTDNIIEEKINKKLNYNNDKIIIPGEKLQPAHKLYLKKRGLNPEYIEEKYKLKGTLHDKDYAYRIIIPIYENNKIVSYQTRGISKNEKYINCKPELEIKPIKDTLYNIDNCKKDYIIVTEGVFKVFKLGNNSCATYGKNVSNKQIQLLTKYKKVFIAFDPDDAGIEGTEKLSNILSNLGVETYNIICDKPPDNFTRNEVKTFWSKIIENL